MMKITAYWGENYNLNGEVKRNIRTFSECEIVEQSSKETTIKHDKSYFIIKNENIISIN